MYGHETWWVGSILDANNFEGGRRSSRDQIRQMLVHGHETWWVGSILDANNFEGGQRSSMGHPRSNGVNIGVWT